MVKILFLLLGWIFSLYLFLKIKRENRKNSDFLLLTAHELRSFLTIIYGYSETLLEENLSQEQKKICLEKIHFSSKQLNKTLEALLQLEKAPALKTRTPLKNLIKPLEAAFKEKHPSYPIIIKNNAQTKSISIHPQLFFLALSNLLDNAVKHGSSPIILEINSSHKKISFTVKDQGKEVLKKLSKLQKRKFCRGASKGSGLGLYLVKKIAQLHKAKVSMNSSENKETAFTIDLPL